jgi:thiamine-phosphate pyrophosphorylase
MLQFITRKNERYGIEEQVKMVLEGGCKWIELDMNDATAEEVKAIIENLIPLCKEADAILVVDDYVDIVKEMEVTGLRLIKDSKNVGEVRNILEGGPIIGVNVSTAGDIYALKGIDVDYVTIEINEPHSLDSIYKIVSEVREAGINMPIVAIGEITIENIKEVIATGVNGVAMSDAIVNAENPTEYTKKILSILYK